MENILFPQDESLQDFGLVCVSHRETSRDALLEFIVSTEKTVCMFTFLVLLNKIICDLGKITKSTPNQSGHFAPAYLGGRVIATGISRGISIGKTK